MIPDNPMKVTPSTRHSSVVLGPPVPLERVDHPAHYGGRGNPYEAIKVVEAWELDFHLGNAIKYICRAGKKGSEVEDLRKAAWYLQRKIERLSEGKT